MTMFFRVLAIAVVVGAEVSGSAQVGAIWPAASLHEKAQLIVVANAITTTDTGRKVPHPGLRNFPAIEMTTEFQVLEVLKSDSATPLVGDRFILRYYRHDWQQWRADHPAEPGKPPPGVVNTGTALEIPSKSGPYKLFLIRTDHGLEPVSGHTFPTESVVRVRKQRQGPGQPRVAPDGGR